MADTPLKYQVRVMKERWWTYQDKLIVRSYKDKLKAFCKARSLSFKSGSQTVRVYDTEDKLIRKYRRGRVVWPKEQYEEKDING